MQGGPTLQWHIVQVLWLVNQNSGCTFSQSVCSLGSVWGWGEGFMWNLHASCTRVCVGGNQAV